MEIAFFPPLGGFAGPLGPDLAAAFGPALAPAAARAAGAGAADLGAAETGGELGPDAGSAVVVAPLGRTGVGAGPDFGEGFDTLGASVAGGA